MDILKNDVPIRVIESESEYATALERLAQVMARTPEPGSDEDRQVKTLALVICDYESKHYSIPAPDPIDAIRFRMEQQGLTPRDLIPYLGSRSRVSEVLSGKRRLTLAMIRNLHHGLGIPAVSLIGGKKDAESAVRFDWMRLPFVEMRKRGWITRVPRDVVGAKQMWEAWIEPLKPAEFAPLYKCNYRTAKPIVHERLIVWTAQLAKRALNDPPSGKFEASWSPDLLREVARISVFRDGPALVQEFLEQHGVVLLVERSMSPWLDGAAFICRGVPVVGLTLRHDRLDNFWFVLMHELVHVFRHLSADVACFYDDLDVEGSSQAQEEEADALAAEMLVPAAEWKASPASKLRSAEAALHLAQRLKINPAIVAGKIRRAYGDYRLLSGLVGHGEVRRQFPEFDGE